MRIWTCILIIALSIIHLGHAPRMSGGGTAYLDHISREHWIDSVRQSLTLDEKIGQLFMIRAHSDLGPEHIKSVKRQIQKYDVGGLCFFQGTPEKQIELTNDYQRISKLPLFIAMDAEWGLGMRFKADGFSFPRQMTLGAIQDNRLIYQMGKEIARQLQRIGVHINFAPVVDINNNPDNPVIHTRSFGEDRHRVTEKSLAYARGLQDGGVMACAKHFPGHGDTDTDSHLDLPVIPHDYERLDSIELFPFRVLAQANVGAMMSAHLHVPALDSTPQLPSSLSEKIITNLLRDSLNYRGLVFTDALEMKGVTKHFPPGELEVRALEAGNDILLLPQNLPQAVKAIKKALKSGRLQMKDIDRRLDKILAAKFAYGPKPGEEISNENLLDDLFTPHAMVLKRQLAEAALTLVKNKDHLIPFQNIHHQKWASLSIGSDAITRFQQYLDHYTKIDHYHSEDIIGEGSTLFSQLRTYDRVVIALYGEKTKPAVLRPFLNRLKEETQLILVHFDDPYRLQNIDDYDWVLQAYDEDPQTEDLAAQALFGAFRIRGKLPVTASKALPVGTGIGTASLLRLGYGLPESVGMNRDTLALIDELLAEGIDSKAFPGAQVLVAHRGKVVVNKAAGFHTYEKKRPVTKNDLYDLASVTKVLASTLAIMKLAEEGKLNIFDPIKTYLPELAGTNKGQLTLEDIMAHHAGLRSWLPFYRETIEEDGRNIKLMDKWYRTEPSDSFPVAVTESIYLRADYRDSIYQFIESSTLSPYRKYVYSDLGFYLIPKIIERVSGQPMDMYLQRTFYEKLGLKTTCFNPHQTVPLAQVVPSEEDNYYRAQTIHGYVHDFGAAMLGGVSGHAGLFSNAEDLAVLLQMLLNHGYYGGKKYLHYGTIKLFTTRHPASSRRGIGFDMKEINPDKSQNTGSLPSALTFGHLGFTGTAVWADPQHDIIYIFLSNRTYPSMMNNKLGEDNYRPKIQDIIYRSLGVGQE